MTQGNYANVNGLRMYYEVHGSGRPLVLLHGSFSATGTSFGKVLPPLAERRQVISIEQQGHGRTADINRPLSIPQMADDTAALLQGIGIDRADFFGYSLGSGVALQIAVQYPSLVRKLVLASITYNRAGFIPGLLEGIEALTPEMMAGTPWQEEYARLAPRPEDWPILVSKIKDLDREITEWSPEAVRSVQAPVLLVCGDSDIVRLGHAVEMYRLVGGEAPIDASGLSRSWLAVLPGTTHVTVVDRASWLVPMVNEFLDAPMPEAG